MSMDRRILQLARLAESEPTPELFLQLGQLYLREDQLAQAQAAFAQGIQTTRAVVRDLASGEVSLDEVRLELQRELEETARALALRGRRAEREALVARLEAPGLSPSEHDALLRLEVELGLPLHPEPLRCPACAGPMEAGPQERPGSVRCARTGEGGDLCRHMDAVNLYGCSTCGFVLRAWTDRRPGQDDPHEAPFIRPERTRCPYCQGRVADWTHHYNSCPQASPGRFPRCEVCRQRGFHRRPIRCPRCAGEVGETPCAERRRR